MADDGRILVLLAAAGLAAAGAVRQRARLSSPDSLLSTPTGSRGVVRSGRSPNEPTLVAVRRVMANESPEIAATVLAFLMKPDSKESLAGGGLPSVPQYAGPVGLAILRNDAQQLQPPVTTDRELPGLLLSLADVWGGVLPAEQPAPGLVDRLVGSVRAIYADPTPAGWKDSTNRNRVLLLTDDAVTQKRTQNRSWGYAYVGGSQRAFTAREIGIHVRLAKLRMDLARWVKGQGTGDRG